MKPLLSDHTNNIATNITTEDPLGLILNFTKRYPDKIMSIWNHFVWNMDVSLQGF